MADPLSIAAAGAGFLSLAGQVGDGLIKLRGLYLTLKNAPRSIERLIQELQLLRKSLEFADKQLSRSFSSGIDTAQLGAAFAQCEKTRCEVEAVLEKLNHGIGKCKATAWKYVFKKDEVNEMLAALGRSDMSYAVIAILNNPNNTCVARGLQSLHDLIRHCDGGASRYRLTSNLAELVSDADVICSIGQDKPSHAWLFFALAKIVTNKWIDDERWPAEIVKAMQAATRAGLDPHARLPKNSRPWTLANGCQLRLSGRSDRAITPLVYLCIEQFAASYRSPETALFWANHDLEHWVRSLLLAGVDLMAYGQREKLAVETSLSPFVGSVFSGMQVSLVVGPNTRDWHLSMEHALKERYANDFWRLVDGMPTVPHLATEIFQAWHRRDGSLLSQTDMPGSWQSECPWTLNELEMALNSTNDCFLSDMEDDISTRNSTEFFERWYDPGRFFSHGWQRYLSIINEKLGFEYGCSEDEPEAGDDE